MYYLTTGTNGAGKTLNVLEWVRELQLESNRPVYYVGFDIVPEYKEQFGWQEFEPTKWMDLPDGSICIMDECQKYFPNRPVGSKVPDYVMALTEHRKRGFDFFMITQHPGNIDSFIRKLIGSPSWHRHLKRIAGQNIVNCIEWNYCHSTPEKPSATSEGTKKLIPYPKEAFKWYKSAEIHTVKKTIPKKVILFGLCILAVPVLIFFAMTKLNGFGQVEEQNKTSVSVPKQFISPEPVKNNLLALTKEEYVQSFVPRIPPFLHTAPRYDEITKPVTAPYPAICVYRVDYDLCKCYTQQATPYDTDKDVCMNIAMNGYFMDWDTNKADRGVSGGDPSDLEPS